MSSRVFHARHATRGHDPHILRMTSGFRRFQQRWYHDDPVFDSLRLGQSPHSLVIACSDSRVDPILLTDSRPGELFVVRNVANIVPPYVRSETPHGVSSALEYAVKHLKVKDIVVMGHACCGGIHALIAGETRGGGDEFIDHWVGMAGEALERARSECGDACEADLARSCEMWNVRISLENLTTFPWVKNLVEERKLALHGWYFDLQSGELLEYDSEKGGFCTLVGRFSVHAHPLAGEHSAHSKGAARQV